MKKLFLYALLSLFANQINAQSYSFEHFQQEYTYLQHDSSISEGILWGNTTWDIPLNFHFEFLGRDFEGFTAWGNGIYFDFANERYFIESYLAYVLDKGLVTPGPEILSPISIQQDGEEGNRIFKIQYRNAGFIYGTENDSVNYQVWLYETTNVFEIHFGSRNVESVVWDDGLQAPVVAFAMVVDSSFFIMEGDPYMPTLQHYNSTDTTLMISGLTDAPPENAVWRFTPQLSPVRELQEPLTLKLWPNPCTNWLKINSSQSLEGSQARIFDATGQLMLEQNIGEKALINVGALPPGGYCLSVASTGVQFTERFIKH